MRFESLNSNVLDEKLIEDLRDYIRVKTGKLYLRNIKRTGNNIMITCPFHKDGQERKPSCGIRITPDEYSSIGTVHCFTCGETMSLSEMVRRVLGSFYDENDVEARFGLKILMAQYQIIEQKNEVLFEIPKEYKNEEKLLRNYRYYHSYLESRGISDKTAAVYDIGYDKYNDQITFPLRDRFKNCLGIGRRSIKFKRYEYPKGMLKPIYGVYELPKFINYIWIVERAI